MQKTIKLNINHKMMYIDILFMQPPSPVTFTFFQLFHLQIMIHLMNGIENLFLKSVTSNIIPINMQKKPRQKVSSIHVLVTTQLTLITRNTESLTEDEIVLIEHLPGRRVHLQDFFWTGAEDAPPWLDPEQLLTLYETRTIHHTATVYIPDEQNPQTIDGEAPRPIDCASCIDPTPTLPDQDVGVLVGDDPGPRWVFGGFNRPRVHWEESLV